MCTDNRLSAFLIKRKSVAPKSTRKDVFSGEKAEKWRQERKMRHGGVVWADAADLSELGDDDVAKRACCEDTSGVFTR